MCVKNLMNGVNKMGNKSKDIRSEKTILSTSFRYFYANCMVILIIPDFG